jgi:hypothetical protein
MVNTSITTVAADERLPSKLIAMKNATVNGTIQIIFDVT